MFSADIQKEKNTEEFAVKHQSDNTILTFLSILVQTLINSSQLPRR